MLGKLHRGELLHRDLTPMNVFVCDARRLKLGDFGIVRSMSDRRLVPTRTLNPAMAPSEVVAGIVPKWQARDDVYQVGQLLAMLVKADASRRVRTPEVRHLNCSDQLKEIVYRCIGERRKRCETAAKAAKRAGAIVHDGPSTRTMVVVRGRPNPLQAAGPDGGLKLMEIKRLREKGHKIKLLNEKQFWSLAATR